MIEVTGNLFKYSTYSKTTPDAICITTNGSVKSNGHAVMGRGCAKTACQLFGPIDKTLGTYLNKYGNRVFSLGKAGNVTIFTYPVKPKSEIYNGSNAVSYMKYNIGDTIPGWACKASLKLIKKSAIELVEQADKRNLSQVIIPRMGCGAGELTWDVVKSLVSSILDDRFSIITF